MTKRKLGRQGLEVSAIGLGCMGMSQSYGSADDNESVATIHRALPICSHIAGILSGGHASRAPATPAQSKIQPTIAKVLLANVVAQIAHQTPQLLSLAVHNERAVRNVCSLGSLRVDDDIGLHTLFSTFLILSSRLPERDRVLSLRT